MINYTQNNNDANIKEAVIDFLSHAESVGAIKEDSSFLKESMMKMLSKNPSSGLEEFNSVAVESLKNEVKLAEKENG